MELLCKQDKFTCLNYSDGDCDINTVRKTAGTVYEDEFPEPRIVILRKGRLRISYRKFMNRDVSGNQMFVIPQGCLFRWETVHDTEALVISLNHRIEFCERLPLEWLYDAKEHDVNELGTLDVNDRLKDFLKTISSYIQDGIKCNGFIELKIREFLFILGTYYPKRDLAKFFHSITFKDTSFSDFVFENYARYKTVQQLAEASCYSLSAFNKIFRRTFGVSPYKWMQEQKAGRIYYSINISNKSLKEISDEHGFSSLSQLSNFCKAKFGMSPRKIKELSGKGRG